MARKIHITKDGKKLHFLTLSDAFEFFFSEPKTMARFLFVYDDGIYYLVDGLTGQLLMESENIGDLLDEINNRSPGGLVIFHNISEAEVPEEKLIIDYVYFYTMSGKFINLEKHNDIIAVDRISLSQMPTGPAGYTYELTGPNLDPIMVDPNGRYQPAAHTHSRSDITDFWNTPFWDNIPDKPTTFPPSSHTHPWGEITDKPSEFPPESHTHTRSEITDFWNAPFWSNIPDKPSTYPPSAHTHSRDEVTDFWDTPFWDNIPDKPSTFPPSSHTHPWSEITDKPSEYPPEAHTHTRSEITDFFNSPFWSAIPDKPFESFDSISASIIPSSDNTYDLGSNSLHWKNIYFSGSLHGGTLHANIDWSYIQNVPSFALDDLSNVNDSTILNKLKNVDGSGSGLDADTLDGHDSSYFATATHSHTINNLSDVTISSPSSGQVLTYDGSKWINANPSSSVGSLNDLSDVSLSSPSSGNVLKYNGNEWTEGSVDWNELTNVPSTFPPSSHTHTVSDISDIASNYAKTDLSNVSDSTILNKIKNVDGSGSGLDADTLDGHDSSYFATAGHSHPRSDITDFWNTPFWENIPDKPSTFTPSAHTHPISDVSINNSLIPTNDGTYNLGSSSYYWNYLYVEQVKRRKELFYGNYLTSDLIGFVAMPKVNNLAYQSVVTSEYYDFNDSSWKTWATDPSSLFDNDFHSGITVNYDYRKFRITIHGDFGWSNTSHFVIVPGYSQYMSGTTVTVTIEKSSDNSNWTTIVNNYSFFPSTNQPAIIPLNNNFSGNGYLRFTFEISGLNSGEYLVFKEIMGIATRLDHHWARASYTTNDKKTWFNNGLYPSSDAAFSLGDSNYRWNDAYFAGTIHSNILSFDQNTVTTEDVTFDGSTSTGLKVSNSHGYVTITPLNDYWAHIYTDRSRFIFNKPVYSIADTFSSYDAPLLLQKQGSTKLKLDSSDSIFYTNVLPDSDASRNLGNSSYRWNNIYGVNIYAGDVIFMNGWRITEFDDDGNLINGIRILDASGKEIIIIRGVSQ